LADSGIGLPRRNDLAYFACASAMKIKVFEHLHQLSMLQNFFLSSLMWLNKLECSSLASLSLWVKPGAFTKQAQALACPEKTLNHI
jgi:hypothetical protein